MKREEWIARLQECSEEDLPYLSMLFNDWRQEELGEDLLCPAITTKAKVRPLLWFKEGPELVSCQPIRQLYLEDFWTIRSATYPGYRACSFIGNYLDTPEDKEIREAIQLWFPKPLFKEDNGYTSGLLYYPGNCTAVEIQDTVNRNALLWAREESKKRRGLASPYTTPQVPAHVIDAYGNRL